MTLLLQVIDIHSLGMLSISVGIESLLTDSIVPIPLQRLACWAKVLVVLNALSPEHSGQHSLPVSGILYLKILSMLIIKNCAYLLN
jgi:hypothetical protein